MIVPKHYENLNVLHENTMPYRAYYMSALKFMGALVHDRENSDRIQMLNGNWKFRFYESIYDLEEKEKKPDDKDKRNEKGIHREEKDAEEIIDKALKLCDKYEKIFSRTLPESEIYALNHGTLPMEDGYYLLSEECAALIEKGLYYSELSGGAFDITIEPVSSLWDFTSGEKIVPDAETIAEKQACVGYEDVELKGNKLRFKLSLIHI